MHIAVNQPEADVTSFTIVSYPVLKATFPKDYKSDVSHAKILLFRRQRLIATEQGASSFETRADTYDLNTESIEFNFFRDVSKMDLKGARKWPTFPIRQLHQNIEN